MGAWWSSVKTTRAKAALEERKGWLEAGRWPLGQTTFFGGPGQAKPRVGRGRFGGDSYGVIKVPACDAACSS